MGHASDAEVPGAEASPGTLAGLRASWPSRVSWSAVRAESPGVFWRAALGALLLLFAVATGLFWAALTFEWPGVVVLPRWLDWSIPLLMVVALLGAIMIGLFALIFVTQPADTRRGIAFSRFAEREGLGYGRFGYSPPRAGVFFAEQLPGPREQLRSRPRSGASGPASLFRTSYVLWQGDTPIDPPLQLGVASYSGGKDDPKGPRNAFRYLSLSLPRVLPHLMIDARGNGSLRTLLPGTQRLSLEGDFDRYFTAYVPAGYERDALELLTPDVMACLIDHGRAWDIEVIDDRLLLASTRIRARTDRTEVAALLHFARLVGDELGHQASTYSDPRAVRPRAQLAAAGRRLRRRSGVWAVVIITAAVVVMLGYPFVLGWFLDR